MQRHGQEENRKPAQIYERVLLALKIQSMKF